MFVLLCYISVSAFQDKDLCLNNLYKSMYRLIRAGLRQKLSPTIWLRPAQKRQKPVHKWPLTAQNRVANLAFAPH